MSTIIAPQNDLLSQTSRKLLERNSEFMTKTELPSLLNPMWRAKVMKVLRQRHGKTPAFASMPDLIRHYYGQDALEIYDAVFQLKRTIRLMGGNE